jgi:uncharacterized caspase-like protein
MRANPSPQKRRHKIVIAALTTILSAGQVLGWQANSQAQQDRQLVKTDPTRANSVRRIALVIGNGAYTNAPPLKNPANDARDMAATLKQLGFTVASAIDADQRTMKGLIREFGQQLKSGGQGLFYFAGHGVQLRGRNYLIPANAEITSETDVEDQGVDLTLVLGLMDEAENGLNIVILDACRNNPFARSFRSAGSGLAQVDAPTGTLIAYATSPGRVANDGQGRNGLYTSELLREMLVTGIGVEEMFKRVRVAVQRQTSGQQVPWESSSLVGNFYFAAPTPSASTPNANNNAAGEGAVNRIALDPGAFELSYWESIKSSTSADDFNSYLAKYPEGQFASLAKNRIKNLEVVTTPAQPAPTSRDTGSAEIAFWDSVKNSTNAEDFRAYLKKYPNGEFADLAKNRLAPLELEIKKNERLAETARRTKSFRGIFGTWGIGGVAQSPGQLIVSPTNIEFVVNEAWARSVYAPDVAESVVERPWPLDCSRFDIAKVSDSFISEIRYIVQGKEKGRLRFKAESRADAMSALQAIREVCPSTGKD